MLTVVAELGWVRLSKTVESALLVLLELVGESSTRFRSPAVFEFGKISAKMSSILLNLFSVMLPSSWPSEYFILSVSLLLLRAGGSRGGKAEGKTHKEMGSK